MYDITCHVTGEVQHLDHSHVLSSHRVSKGHLVYLRCTCGSVVMWTTPPASSHHIGAELALSA